MDLKLCFVSVAFLFPFILFPMAGVIKIDKKDSFHKYNSHNWCQSMRYIRYACISRQHPMRSIKQT